ncbi:hypothetical protein ACKI1K_07140 [Streptomyces scabiei]|uniref:hypothetical protein n=1 Tax=Streptomyces scabiei TaxID=1930 RepID=UPI0038F6EE23
MEAVREDVQRSEAMLAGALVIGPREMPEGLELSYPDACTRLGIQPRAEGYALWALLRLDARTGQMTRSMLVTTLVEDTRTALSVWRMGVECALPDLVGDQAPALITALDDWPLPITPVPHLADPATFDDE